MKQFFNLVPFGSSAAEPASPEPAASSRAARSPPAASRSPDAAAPGSDSRGGRQQPASTAIPPEGAPPLQEALLLQNDAYPRIVAAQQRASQQARMTRALNATLRQVIEQLEHEFGSRPESAWLLRPDTGNLRPPQTPSPLDSGNLSARGDGADGVMCQDAAAASTLLQSVDEKQSGMCQALRDALTELQAVKERDCGSDATVALAFAAAREALERSLEVLSPTQTASPQRQSWGGEVECLQQLAQLLVGEEVNIREETIMPATTASSTKSLDDILDSLDALEAKLDPAAVILAAKPQNHNASVVEAFFQEAAAAAADARSGSPRASPEGPEGSSRWLLTKLRSPLRQLESPTELRAPSEAALQESVQLLQRQNEELQQELERLRASKAAGESEGVAAVKEVCRDLAAKEEDLQRVVKELRSERRNGHMKLSSLMSKVLDLRAEVGEENARVQQFQDSVSLARARRSGVTEPVDENKPPIQNRRQCRKLATELAATFEALAAVDLTSGLGPRAEDGSDSFSGKATALTADPLRSSTRSMATRLQDGRIVSLTTKAQQQANEIADLRESLQQRQIARRQNSAAQIMP
eukprot:TRINITY_DN31093_c0_g1_i4.p1 TRINITY_DN31093_c0_g1~~TRINITY_DN31093_c0_g1_i4.p1  ORF type:complete len:586 (+),score=165.84 TRINITY_DN31093_c0_g1_i4:66-1823(+)